MAESPAYDLFVSYAEADRAWVEGYLLDALTQAGVRCHSEAAFALGAPLLTEFERAVQQSRRTLLVLSPAFLADGFDAFADLLAQSYGLETGTWPVIPLVLRPVQLPPRLAMLTRLDAVDSEDWPNVVRRLCEALQHPTRDDGAAVRPPCPYPGMMPFGEADRERFFGRDDEVREALERLRVHPFLTVIGPSGSGKSSLVFAGLLPALRHSSLWGPGEWAVRTLRPGEAPLAALATTLGGEPDNDQPHDAIARLLAERPDPGRLLLIVDQFEEVFTLARPDEAASFQHAVMRIAAAPNCFVILTARADFYPELMTSPLWRPIQGHRLEVLPLSEEGLRKAIVNPAAKVGVYVEAALVERLAADAAGEPGVLPLVQETLVLLWERLERRFLPLRAYEALVLPRSAYGVTGSPNGAARTGLQVALTRRADAAVGELADEQQAMARRIFLRLVQFGEGRADTRRQQRATELLSVGDDPAQVEQVLRHLAGRRLLTLGGEAGSGERTVDIAHESLISCWPQLQAWLAARREAEQARRRLEAKASEWVRLGQGKGGLLDEAELAEAERWLTGPDAAELGYAEALPALVATSRAAIAAAEQEREAARERELEQARALAEEQRRRAEEQAYAARRLRVRLAAAAIFAVVAVTAAVGALVGFQRAERQASIARVQALAALAPRQHEVGEDERGALLARQAYLFNAGSSGPAQAQVDAALRAVHGVEHFSRILRHEDAVNAVAFSADGRTLAAGDRKGAVRLWELGGSPAATSVLPAHEGWVAGVAFSPRDRTLASGGREGTVRLWDLDEPTRDPAALSGPPSLVASVAFSPDGRILAAGGDTGITLWDLDQPASPPTALNGATGTVRSVAFGQGGRSLAGVGGDGAVWLWDLGRPDADPTLVPNSEGKPVESVAFSPDGGKLAAGGRGGVWVWDWSRASASPTTLAGPETPVTFKSVTFSRDGQTLAAASSADGQVWLWRLDQPTRPAVLRGHEGIVTAVAFSPDGRTVASGGGDRTVRLWELGEPPEPTRLRGHEGPVNSVAFSPDGETVASGGDDRIVRLWAPANPPTAPQVLTGIDGRVRSVAFNRDGRRLAAGSDKGTIWIWDLGQPDAEPVVLRHGKAGINSVAFDAGGGTLAAGSWDGTVSIWDVTQATAPTLLSGREGAIRSVAFRPDGRMLATGGCVKPGTELGVCDEGGVRLWDPSLPAAPPTVLGGFEEMVTSIAFAADGTRLAAGGHDGSVRLWNPDEPSRRPVTLSGPRFAVASVAFSADGRFLAAGLLNATVSVWDLDHPGAPTVLAGHEGYVNSVAFSPTGWPLASGGADRVVHIWADAQVLAERVCERVERNLSPDEWRQFVGDVPYESTCPDLPPGRDETFIPAGTPP